MCVGTIILFERGSELGNRGGRPFQWSGTEPENLISAVGGSSVSNWIQLVQLGILSIMGE